MNRRQTKKRNKKIHKNILSFIPFTVIGEVYGNGYFIFEYEDAGICWFYLKEFPKWKFGIWLNKEGFEIFGQAVASIDKFKPSRSEFTTDDINLFVNSLYELHYATNLVEKDETSEDELFQYLIENEKYIKEQDRMDRINHKKLNFINSFIRNYNDSNLKIHFELHDRNSKNIQASPRYYIYVSTTKDTTDDEIFKAFLYLEEAFDTMINSENVLSIDDMDNFLTNTFIFDYFGEEIKGKKFYNHQRIKYEWKDSYEEYLDGIYNMHVKQYDVLNDELHLVIGKFSGDSYIDADDILKAVYDKYTALNLSYNQQYASGLCFSQARKNRKQKGL